MNISVSFGKIARAVHEISW